MKETLKPIFVLTGICLIVAVLLAATNGITAPIIAANAEAKGVTEAARAENGAGWVITAQAQGYGGMVPVMVAFGEDGTIRAVQFLANDETPGLGQKVRNEDFSSQFAGKTAENAYQIDTISGATISSNAAIVAVEHACAAYEALASGGQSAQSTQEGGVQE